MVNFIYRLAHTQSPLATKELIECTPGFGHPGADLFLAKCLEDPNISEGPRQMFENLRLLLADCREKGIDRAFRDQLANSLTDQQLEAILAFLGEPASDEGVEDRIFMAHQALAWVEKEAGGLFGALHVELAESYQKLPQTPIHERLVTYHYRQALMSLDSTQNSSFWFPTLIELGRYYLQRSSGNQQFLFRCGRACLRKVLKYLNSENLPLYWISAVNSLAIHYLDDCGKTRQLDIAIGLWEKTISSPASRAFPLQLAQMLASLGKAYRQRNKNEADLKRAICVYQESLAILEATGMTELKALVSLNLANLYASHSHDTTQRAKALELYREAILILNTDECRNEWADAKISLGSLLLSDGSEPQDRALAKAAFDDVHRIIKPEESNDIWARIHLALSQYWQTEPEGEDTDNRLKARAHCQKALEKEDALTPNRRGLIYSHLGQVLLHSRTLDRASDERQAYSALCMAAELLNPQVHPQEWAGTLIFLAQLLTKRVIGNRSENIAKALKLLARIYPVIGTRFPRIHIQTLNTEAWILSRSSPLQNFPMALEKCQAVDCMVEKMRLPLILADNQFLMGNIYSQAPFNEISTALSCLDKAIAIRKERGTRSDYFRTLYLKGQLLFKQKKWSNALDLFLQVIDFEKHHKISIPLNPSEKFPDFQHARQDAAYCWCELGAYLNAIQTLEEGAAKGFKKLTGISQKSVTKDTLNRILKNINKPIIYLITGDNDCIALFAYYQKAHLILEKLRIPGVSEHHLQKAFYIPDGQDMYLQSIFQYNPQLKGVLDNLWPLLKRLTQPICNTLRHLGFSSALLVTSGDLSSLPLSAVADLPLSFTPTISYIVGSKCWDSDDNQGLFVSVAPTESGPLVPKFAAFEVNEIRSLFDVKGPDNPLTEESYLASNALIQNYFQEAYFFHIASHAWFNIQSPLDSYFVIGEQETFSLRDVIGFAKSTKPPRLVVLSACQTGLSDVLMKNEHIGFPTAFLAIGVQGVLATLWPVEDLSNALFMKKFYEIYLQENTSFPRSLFLAREWLRQATVDELRLVEILKSFLEKEPDHPDLFRQMRYYQTRGTIRPYEHPYYWAGYCFFGL